MDIADEVFLGRLAFIITSGGFALIVNWLAAQAGFYRRLPPLEERPTPSFENVLFVFLAFFLIHLILVPLAIYLWLSFQARAWQDSTLQIPTHTQIWLNGIAIWISSIAIWGACRLFQPTSLQSISNSETAKNIIDRFRNLNFGFLTWFICYPIVFTLNLSLTLLLESWTHEIEVDQVAVKLLKAVLDDPLQLIIYFMGVVIVAPLIEEFMFRGILQRWLIGKIGRWSGILIASLCFAAMHYAHAQGISNLQILPSLFVLSCYLGYIYERQGSLWAPIGLHAIFNFISACLVVYQGG